MRGKFKLFSIFLFLTMIFSFFVSSQNVFAGAPANLDGYNCLQFTGESISGIADVSGGQSVKVTYGNVHTVTVTGTGLYSLKNSNNDYLVYYKLEGNETLTVAASQSKEYIGELKVTSTNDNNDEGQRGASFSFTSQTAGNMTVEATFRECKKIEIGSHAYSDCKITSMEGEQGGNSVTINFEDGNKITVERINGGQIVPVEELNGSGLYPYKDTTEGTSRYFIRRSAGNAGYVDIKLSPADGHSADLSVSSFGFIHRGCTDPIDEERKYEGLFKKCVPYFVWLDNDGNVCYHKFLNFTVKRYNGSYNMNYVHINELTDEKISNRHNYEFGQQPAGWVLAKDMEDAGCSIKSNLTKEYIFGNGQDNAGVVLDSYGAVNGANSICTNGGGNFKATIYRDGYKAVDIFPDYFSPNDHFFPNCWNEEFFPSRVDISGTTPENPAVFKTYLLTPLILDEAPIVGDSEVISVCPVNVSGEAINCDRLSTAIGIKFYSNYYDHAVFEITMENDENKYYVKIERMAFDITSESEGDNKKVLASFYYPSDIESMNSCDNFDVVATKVNKDGTTEVIVVEPDADKKDLEGGDRLKKSQYTVDVDDNVEGVYFTALRKGGAGAGQVEYAGTFSGSGRGIYYDLNNKQMRYDD